MDERAALAEILERYATEGGDPEAVLAEHPELAELLRPRLEALRALEAALQEPDLPTGTPDRIGDFRIVRELGRGGMGVVYEAEQSSMRRRVALKVLSLGFSGTQQAVRRFRREARAAGLLHHTNIVPIHAMGRHGPHWYYAMELVEGRPLDDVLVEMRTKGQPGATTAGDDALTQSGQRGYFQRVAEMFAGVAEALHLAHDEGIIHRDIKPSNLLLSRDGVLKIVDFGLAHSEQDGLSLTATGDLLGTPAYMSPEQARAKHGQIDHRTDVYSLGATLYEVLTHQAPFRAKTLPGLWSEILTKDPVPPRRMNLRVPRDLQTIVLKAMEKEPQQRYATAGEFARDLDRFAQGVAVRARRIGLAGRLLRKVKRHKTRSALAAAAVLLTVVGTLFAVRAQRESERRIELEYAHLLVKAQESMSARMRIGRPRHGMHVGPDAVARDLLARAIALDPERCEAYWLRALAPGRCLDERLADADAARARGLSDRTVHLLRALVYASAQRWDESQAERKRVAPVESETPQDAYLDGWLCAAEGDVEKASVLFGKAIDTSPRSSAVRILALRSRARLHRQHGRFDESLEDLHAVRTLAGATVDLEMEIAATWRRMGREDVARRRFEETLASTRARNRAGPWRSLADACREHWQYDWHAEAAEAALELHGDDGTLLLEWALALGQQERREEQLETVRRALAAEPDDHLAREIEAVALNHLGRNEEALTAIDGALAEDQRCPLAWGKRAAILRALDRYEEAMQSVDAGLRVAPDEPLLHLERGLVLYGRKDWAGARRAFDHVLKLDPRHVDAHFWLGNVLEEQGELKDALAALDAAIDLDPSHHRAISNRGFIYARAGRDEDAIREYDAALKIAPDDALTLDNRARAFVRRKQPDRALADFKASLAHDDASATTWLAMGSLLANEWNQDVLAEEAFQKAVKLDPTLVRAWRNISVVRQKRKLFEEAEPPLQEAIRRAPERLGLRVRLALLHEKQGSPEKALHTYDEILEKWPRHAQSLFRRGRLYFESGHFDEAADDFCDATEIEPKAAPSWANLGLCMFHLDRHEKAVEFLKKALALNDRITLAYEYLGSAHLALGRHEDAIRACEVVHRRDPRNIDNVTNLVRALLESKQHARAILICEAAEKHAPEHAALAALHARARAGPEEAGTTAESPDR